MKKKITDSRLVVDPVAGLVAYMRGWQYGAEGVQSILTGPVAMLCDPVYKLFVPLTSDSWLFSIFRSVHVCGLYILFRERAHLSPANVDILLANGPPVKNQNPSCLCSESWPGHGRYFVNRNVRYGLHNMAAAEPYYAIMMQVWGYFSYWYRWFRLLWI